MKRATFASSMAVVACFGVASAAGKDTVILLTATNDDIVEEATSALAEGLRARGVSVVDPSKVSLTVHEKTVVVAVSAGNAGAIEASRVSWIERKYNASRALFVNIREVDREVPYGEFTVNQLLLVCSYRCMNVADGTIVKAGSHRESRHGEDLSAIEADGASAAMLAIARQASTSLV